MTKHSAGTNDWPRLFPRKVRLLRTGEICENRGYYRDLFTLKLPDGSMAEFHVRELDLKLPERPRPSLSRHSR